MINKEKKQNHSQLTIDEIEDALANAQYTSSNLLVLQSTDYGSLDSYLTDVIWSKQHRHTAIYGDFLDEIEALHMSEIRTGNSSIYLKMRFSYAVTLMESCLSEMIKSVTMQHESFRRNAINNINDLKNLKINAATLLDKNPKDILDNAIMGHLSHIIYHHMDKVSKVYTDILGEDFPSIESDDNKNIRDLIVLRHDIVHRNGKNINGDKIHIDLAKVDSCIAQIRTFVKGVHGYIDRNVEKISEKSV